MDMDRQRRLAAASVRGGGVKRQPATTAKMPSAIAHSSRIERYQGRGASLRIGPRQRRCQAEAIERGKRQQHR